MRDAAGRSGAARRRSRHGLRAALAALATALTADRPARASAAEAEEGATPDRGEPPPDATDACAAPPGRPDSDVPRPPCAADETPPADVPPAPDPAPPADGTPPAAMPLRGLFPFGKIVLDGLVAHRAHDAAVACDPVFRVPPPPAPGTPASTPVPVVGWLGAVTMAPVSFLAPEGAARGQPAGRVLAPGAGGVRYALPDDAGGRFAVDPLTGVVAVADGARLDFEAAASHAIVIEVRAPDGSLRRHHAQVAVEDRPEVLVLTSGADAFTDRGVPETEIRAGDGDDTVSAHPGGGTAIHGEGGHDRLLGGAGADPLHGGAGDDTLDGGAGDDTLWGDAGADLIMGGDGADALYGWEGDDTLDGGVGDDALFGDGGADVLRGGDGADTLYGWSGDDVLDGGAGDDALFGDGGRDVLRGGGGADALYGWWDDDRLEGGDGADRLYGEDGDDSLDGGAGDDRAKGGKGRDVLDGGAGDDDLAGGDGDDTLQGGAGADLLDGGAGRDAAIFAGPARDYRFALDGGAVVVADTVPGRDGTDRLTGMELLRLADGDLVVVTGTGGDDVLDGRAGSVLHAHDFEGGDPSGWTGAEVDTGGSGFGRFLGRASGQGTDGATVLKRSFDLAVVPPGAPVLIAFDYLEIDTWDHEDALIWLDGWRVFRMNLHGNMADEAYAGTAAREGGMVVHYVTKPGAQGSQGFGGSNNDQVHRVEMLVEGAGSALVLGLGARLSSTLWDESFGVDNVEVTAAWDNLLVGGAGHDVAAFAGATGDYRFDVEGGTVVVTPRAAGRGGSDRLAEVEALRFADREWHLVQGTDDADILAAPPGGGAFVIGGEGDDVLRATGGATVLHAHDFEDGSPSGWTGAGVDGGGSALGRFLGPAAGQGTNGATVLERTFDLSAAPAGEAIRIAFDFLEIDSWDEEDAVILLDGHEVLRMNLAHWSKDEPYAGTATLPGGLSVRYATTPDAPANRGFGTWHEQVHRVELLVEGAGPTIRLGLGAALDDLATDESFGIDDVEVSTGRGGLFVGGAGFDAVDYGAAPRGVSVDLADTHRNTGAAAGDAYEGVERVIGSAHADWLFGGAGDDDLMGGAGDDHLRGGACADTLDGGAGTDEVDYALSPAGIVVDLSDAAPERGGHAEGDVLVGIERIRGTDHADHLRAGPSAMLLNGRGGSDRLVGGAGADTLDGGLGHDTLDGGAGDDRFVFAQGRDMDRVEGGAGTDTLRVHGTVGAAAHDGARTIDGNGWTLTLDPGHSVLAVRHASASFSPEAAGTLAFDQGGSALFTGIEGLDWAL